MKGLSILYTSLIACLSGRMIAAATIPTTAIDLQDGGNINESYILNNTTDLNASSLTYVNLILLKQSISCSYIIY